MPTFRYAAYTPSGRIERGEIDSPTRADALSALSARGLVPFESAEATPGKARRSPASRRSIRLGLNVYADLTRELSVLVSADIPLDASLRLLVHQTANQRLKNLAQSLLTGVTAGQPLSGALAQADPNAPTLLVNLLRVGEARGALAPALADLAGFFQARMELESKIRSALIYPAILCIMALGAIAIVVSVLVPALMPIFADSGATPPLILQIAHDAGQAVSAHGLVMALGVILLALALRALLQRPSVRTRLDQVALRLPGVGGLLREANTAIFARTLGTLLHNGVSLLPALEISASIVPSRTIGGAVAEAAERVKEGRRLAEALERTGKFSDLALRFVAIGEEASRLERMLLHLADISDKGTQRSIDHAMTLLSPVLTIGIGALIGGLFVSVMQAMLSVTQLAFQ
jgi:general secretion pathway protein F